MGKTRSYKTALTFQFFQTFISLVIAFMVFATFAVIIALAGDDEPLVKAAHYCNLISFIFITQFIIGCQNFIIAGTICRWYFTRDRTKLHKPIKKSFSHLFKFHLGSVCFSAILVTIVKLFKMLVTAIRVRVRFFQKFRSFQPFFIHRTQHRTTKMA